MIECVRSNVIGRGARCFRYENMWRRHPEYNEFVNQMWRNGADIQNLAQLNSSLNRMQSEFQYWDRSVFGHVKKTLARLRSELEKERRRLLRSGPSRNERRLMAQISELLAREEELEKQRSRLTWLKDGDRNTEFFQARSKVRAHRNRIVVLQNEQGEVVTEQRALEALAVEFYSNLFTAQDELEPEHIVQHVPARVTSDMNEGLCRPFREDEVRRALFMMGPNKAPGPDGFTAGFYQHHWEIVGPCVTRAVLNFLNGGELPSNVNSTTIVLIPKCKNPQNLKQFRPISLCNVIYKICSKVIANRLREVLDDVISVEQSAFVPGRLITDNVLVAYECTHYLKRKKGKSGACAIKLDMAKAYDRVEWEYLRCIMLKLGFHESFVTLIMRCVTSVFFSVKVNGHLSEVFRPSRGIRQGDPISPYLFLLCSEGLSCMLKMVGPVHLSRGVRVGIHAPWISHLLFADDWLVFSEASHRGASRLQEILDTYGRGSGQLVNRDKSSVFFSQNCTDDMKNDVRETLFIENEALAEKYLGLPTSLGRAIKGVFETMPNRLNGLVGGWRCREVSCAGRETLLKSVAQSVPTYPMSCFLLPIDTCKKMKSVISNYWWGSSSDSTRIHWQSWEHLTKNKAQGGMGFRDLRLFNLAMLGKQGWRLMERPDSLCARVLKGRYFYDTDFLCAARKKHASHTWRAILAGRDVLTKGLVKRIGDGLTTNIWRDNWIADHFNGRPISPERQDIQLVSDLLTPSGQWNETLIRSIFVNFDAEAIMRTPCSGRHEDAWSWSKEKHGMYTVRSAYHMLNNERCRLLQEDSPRSSCDGDWKLIWRLEVPPKVRVFWWRVMHEFLPAKQILHKRHIERLAACAVCGADQETIRHVLLECTMAKLFWENTKKLAGVKIPYLHPENWARDLLLAEVCSRREATVIICGMWALWMARNQRRHGEKPIYVQQAVTWARDTAFDLWQIMHKADEVPSERIVERWKPPENDWIKCNVDGAYYSSDGSGATGIVLRDHRGGFAGARAGWQKHSLNALSMEAKAVREGMEFALDKSIRKLVVATDCQELVKLWELGDHQRSVISPILADI